MERGIFLVEGAGEEFLPEGTDRLYAGHEFCSWRLPGRNGVEEMRRAAVSAGAGFTLVTPIMGESGIGRVMMALEGISPGEGDEVVVNDVGLFEILLREKWSGAVAAGRLLTRQRRGAGWKGSLPTEPGAARWLRGSALDSPGFVDFLVDRYGVRRFEIDNLIQGVAVGELPDDVRLSVYYPWLFLTASTLCPWTFDGRRWKRGEGCPSCRGEILELKPEEGGRTILMGGGIQFLENPSVEVYSGPSVDRHVFQPRIPA